MRWSRLARLGRALGDEQVGDVARHHLDQGVVGLGIDDGMQLGVEPVHVALTVDREQHRLPALGAARRNRRDCRF
jgi:hypothetical protein